AAIALVVNRAADAVQVVTLGSMIFQRGDELEIASACGGQKLVQVGQAVDRLLERGHFVFRGAILMLHLAVVTKKGDVVRSPLDAQDAAASIVHLDGLLAEVVADARTFDASGEAA